MRENLAIQFVMGPELLCPGTNILSRRPSVVHLTDTFRNLSKLEPV